MCLARPDIFRTQIRALVRAAEDRDLRILLPMVADVADVRLAKEIIDEVVCQIADETSLSRSITIGAMIELPSAVLTIENLVKEVSFLCIGTNDLVQYLLGADRDNDLVAAWYQSLNPAVLIALNCIYKAASVIDLETIICGEMASSMFYLPVLIGLGFRNFSISPSSLDGVESFCSDIDPEECKLLAKECLSMDSASSVESFLRSQYERRWPDKFPKNLLSSSR
jgi:phosphoenolpyruvate-protein kinase (PTS system EI component)